MARIAHRRNVEWETATKEEGLFTWEQVGVEILMDIRGELQKLNALLQCDNFKRIPGKLDTIARKLPRRTRPWKRRKAEE
jgi:hypothetical protein